MFFSLFFYRFFIVLSSVFHLCFVFSGFFLFIVSFFLCFLSFCLCSFFFFFFVFFFCFSLFFHFSFFCLSSFLASVLHRSFLGACIGLALVVASVLHR